MGLPARLGVALQRFRAAAADRSTLDGLLASAQPGAPLEVRLEWLAACLRWIGRTRPVEGGEAPSGPAQPTRLRHLLNVLDRQPEWKAGVARTLRSTLREADALELYCETGLVREPSFLGEARERLFRRFLPTDPNRRDLGRVLLAAFPDEASAAWLERLDAETLRRVTALAQFELGAEPPDWNGARRDLPDAVVYLVSEIASVGLSSPSRSWHATARHGPGTGSHARPRTYIVPPRQ